MTAQQAVVDTNVLVAAGINRSGNPGQVLAAVERLKLQPVFSAVVIAEYRAVLTRARFGFQAEWVNRLLGNFELLGLRLEPPPIDLAGLPDASDAPFIALARYARCPVITGNTRHFPKAARVVVLTPTQWVASSLLQPL